MWIQDFHTGEMWGYGGPDDPPIEDGIKRLQSARRIVAHNGIDYDVPVLERLYDVELPTIIDTVILSRLLWPDRFAHPAGGSKLKEWGEFLESKGLVERGKDDFTGPWDQWSSDMHTYCKQDVVVNTAILKYVWKRAAKIKRAVKLEHDIAQLVREMKTYGAMFDMKKAESLERKFITLLACYNDKFQKLFPPKVEYLKTPQWYAVVNPNNPKKGLKRTKKSDAIKEGAKKYGITQKEARERLKVGPLREKHTPFNPGSRDQIAERLREKYDWRPTVFTPGGRPQINEETMAVLDYPEAGMFAKYLMLDRRLSNLRGLMAHVKEDGRIHGHVNSIGAVTRRMAHSKPNMNLPSVDSTFGKQFRKLITVPEGKLLVGADLAGMQVRALANRLWKWDDGAYAQVVLNDDIHVFNQKAGHLLTRGQSKTCFYAYLFGAGDPKIGRSIRHHKSLNAEQRESYGSAAVTAIGKQYRANMNKNVKGLDKLNDWLKKSVKRGYIISLDGAPVPIRSEHMALNTLLQADEAVVMKVAWRLAAPIIHELGGHVILNVHDEWQVEAPVETAHDIGGALVDSMREAGVELGMPMDIDGDYRIGKNWKETH